MRTDSEDLKSTAQRCDERTDKIKENLNSEDLKSTSQRCDERTHKVKDILNNNGQKSTVKRSDENTDTAKEKKARIKNWLRLFRSRSSKDNMSVSSKDNASRSSKDIMSPVKVDSRIGSMWPFRCIISPRRSIG